MKSVYLLIAVFCVVPCAFQDVWDEYDTWYDDFNYANDELVEKEDKPVDDNSPKIQNNDNNKEIDDYNIDNGYEDYEIEDNRDEIKLSIDKDQEVNKEQELEKTEESAISYFDSLQQIINNDNLNEDSIDKILAADEKSQDDLNNLSPDDVKNNENVDENDEISDKGTQQNIEEINEETPQVLKNTNNAFDESKVDDSDSNVKDDDKAPEIGIQADMQSIIEETRQILEETNKEFDENKEDKQKNFVEESNQNGKVLEEKKDNSDNPKNVEVKDEEEFPKADIDTEIQSDVKEIQQTSGENNGNVEEALVLEEKVNEETGINNDEDSVDKVYEDLNADLDQLFETWKKLSGENEEEEPDTNVKNVESAESDNKLAMPEEANADDAIGRDEVKLGDEDKEQNNFDYEGESRILAMRDDYYESILDKDLSKLFEEFNDETDDAEKNADPDSDESVPISYVNDALDADSDDINQQDNADIKSVDLENEEIAEDAVEVELNLEDVPENVEQITTPIPTNEDESKIVPEEKPSLKDEVQNASGEKEKTVKLTKDVDELTSSELDELSKQFVILHEPEMKLHGDETPIHITLTADEPVIITSPNYPSAYPTDTTTIDWILEGLGAGIEVNVTDLAINSAMGHYLMLKPGQSDASGDQGIVFAYRLNNERRYRFRDVNKMFVRFNPVGGMSFSRGFQLSARMIEPPVSDEGSNQEDQPEPEYLVPEPRETTTLLLAGINSTGFQEIREEFRRLLADMATMYINANDIDPGMNATSVVTQITRTYVCNVNWPGFDSCVSVTFGVPLVYEDDETITRLTESELGDMWGTYSGRDPFAARLARMGITDYSAPRDSYVLTMWVVVGVAVLISATMLAFVLWRYSCVENYTRMQEYGDTDSIHDKKRGLDMYPTPHQTLPPLYSEHDYKWADNTFDDATRVDMGGFTNNNFTRDEVSDESEDDAAAARDRNAFKPRDFSAV